MKKTNKFKSIGSMVVASAIVLSLVGCGEPASEADSTSSSSETISSSSEVTSETVTSSSETSESEDEPEILPADAEAAGIINEIMTEAKSNGFSLNDEITVNGFNYEGMAKYYTEIPDDSEYRQYVTSITADVSELNVLAYDFTVIGINDLSKVDEIAKYIADNVNWQRFVCVTPSNAAIATYKLDTPEEDGTVAYIFYLMSIVNEDVDLYNPVYDAMTNYINNRVKPEDDFASVVYTKEFVEEPWDDTEILVDQPEATDETVAETE